MPCTRLRSSQWELRKACGGRMCLMLRWEGAFRLVIRLNLNCLCSVHIINVGVRNERYSCKGRFLPLTKKIKLGKTRKQTQLHEACLLFHRNNQRYFILIFLDRVNACPSGSGRWRSDSAAAGRLQGWQVLGVRCPPPPPHCPWSADRPAGLPKEGLLLRLQPPRSDALPLSDSCQKQPENIA